MEITVKKGGLCGNVTSPVSKSCAHRLLICAALGDSPCKIICRTSNDDIDATVSCLCSLGAKIKYKDGVFYTEPIKKVLKGQTLNCLESGSTLRFLLPVAAALGADASFVGQGRLALRPLSPLYELMCENGVKMSPKGVFPLKCEGRLAAKRFVIDGGVSSQFITGLMLASPMTGERTVITIQNRCESAPYIDITVACLEKFGITVQKDGTTFTISGKYSCPSELEVEGDWSSAAFWLTAGVLSKKGEIRVYSLSPDSPQGDCRIISCLEQMGGKISRDCRSGCFIAHPSNLCGSTLDCSDIPDLVPILSVAAAFAKGETTFYNIARLRTKESDRIAAIRALLFGFGIKTEEEENALTVHGGRPGGSFADSFADHRIAMSAAILAKSCGCECVIKGAECVKKSYPDFFADLESLGM